MAESSYKNYYASTNTSPLHKLGFQNLLYIFSYYSIYLDEMECVKHPCWYWCQRFRALVYVLIGILVLVLKTHILIKSLHSLKNEQVLGIATLATNILALFSYLQANIDAKKLVLFLKELCQRFDGLTTLTKRTKTTLKLKRCFVFFQITFFITIPGCLLAQGICVFQIGDFQHFINSTNINKAYEVVSLIDASVLYLLISSFTIFYQMLYLFSVLAMNLLWNDLLNTVKHFNKHLTLTPKDIEEFLMRHQLLCKLVHKCNEIFSLFLFISLTVEIITISATVQGLTHGACGDKIKCAVFFTSLQLFYYITKTVITSSVNKKVIKTLQLTSNLDTQPLPNFSPVHEHYLLYLHEMSSNKVEITYYGMMAVNSKSIFTVVGIIVTYTLAFAELNKINN